MIGGLLSVELQSHANLVDPAFDFVLEDKANKQFLDFLDVNAKLLEGH